MASSQDLYKKYLDATNNTAQTQSLWNQYQNLSNTATEYKPSEATLNYQNQLQSIEASKPGEYQSKYQNYMDTLMDKISNRKFSYDFNADPLYQQYKDQYTKLGNEASMNAVANSAAMTGGYGNSYGATAAAQANQQYLTQLNNVIPELYSAALNKYNTEGQDLYNQFGMYSDADTRDYNKYRDSVTDWNAERDYYSNAYNNSVSQDQWAYNAAEDQRQFNVNNAYNAYNASNANDQYIQKQAYDDYRNAIADEQWKTQFDENVRQFGLNYAIQEAQLQLQREQFEWQKSKAGGSGGGGGGRSSSSKSSSSLGQLTSKDLGMDNRTFSGIMTDLKKYNGDTNKQKQVIHNLYSTKQISAKQRDMLYNGL